MPDRVRERILETYRQIAETYDAEVGERFGVSRWGIESLTGMLLRVMNVKPEAFWFSNPYPAYWRASVPEETRVKLDAKVISEMRERSGPRGFKVTWYTIQAYGSKPTG